MKKRLLLLGTLMVAAFTLSGCGSSKNTETFLMADVQTGDHPSAVACDDFAKLVKEKTDGRVNIEVYHGDSLGTEAEQANQITVGGLDFARLSGPLSAYESDFKIFQSLYLFPSEDDMWSALKSDKGDKYINSSDLIAHKIVGLAWFSGGSRNFYNNKKEVKTPADLKGLSLRVNTDAMRSLLTRNGATGVNVAYNNIYDSIKSGKINGAENNWPSYISTDHYKVAKYITIDQHTCIPELIVASQDALNRMSKEDQKIVKECAVEISKQQIKAMKDYEEEAIKKAKKAGCTITELTKEEAAAFQKEGEAVNAEVFKDMQNLIQELTK